MMDKNEIKKELYKTKVNAKFSHYASGNLYYTIEVFDGTYQFPIETVETRLIESYHEEGTSEDSQLFLSSDLGITPFYNEMKGSELNRWISKAIDKDDFIKIK